MALVNGSVQDITADVALATSNPKIVDNFDDLLENDAALDSRLSTAETDKAPLASPTFTGTVTSPKVVITTEGGIAISLTNKTGVASVKGSLVATSMVTDHAFELQTDEINTIGIVYEDGIADGSECLVVVSGIADVLLKDATASTRGFWAIAADTDGRADITQPTPSPNTTTNEHTIHFKEIGHCLESKVAGTNVLAKCVLHFN